MKKYPSKERDDIAREDLIEILAAANALLKHVNDTTGPAELCIVIAHELGSKLAEFNTAAGFTFDTASLLCDVVSEITAAATKDRAK